MCFGGGGGGGDGGAARREQERQARIDGAIRAIDSVFGVGPGQPSASTNRFNRDRQISGITGDVYNRLTDDINRQSGEANQSSRFELARRGLLGGSAEIDTRDEIARLLDDSLIDARTKSEEVGLNLRKADERSRSALIDRALGGGRAGQLTTDALNGLQLNAEEASRAGSNQRLGDVFSGVGRLFQRGDEVSGVRTGRSQFDKKNKELVGSTFFPASSKGGTGRVISVGG